jgi:hypothetical protein
LDLIHLHKVASNVKNFSQNTSLHLAPVIFRKLTDAGQLANSQLHPEGPETSQLDQGFPWFSLIPEQMLSWYPNST